MIKQAISQFKHMAVASHKAVKQFLAIFLTLIMLLTACKAENHAPKLANNSAHSDKQPELKLVATAFPAYDLANTLLFTQIKADSKLEHGQPNLPFKLSLELLSKAGSDPHTFEPSVQTSLSLEQADMLLMVGGELDLQFARLLKSLSETAKAHLTVFTLSEHVDLLDQDTATSIEAQAVQAPIKDVHIWLSTKRQITLLKALSQQLIAKVQQIYPDYLPAFKTYLTKQLEAWLQHWQALDQAYTDCFQTASKRTLVFADRFPLRYLCHDYNLEAKAAFNSCSHQLDPNLQTLTNLHDFVSQNDIRLVFYTEFGQAKLAQVLTDSTVEITATQAEAYLKTLSKHNVQRSQTELARESSIELGRESKASTETGTVESEPETSVEEKRDEVPAASTEPKKLAKRYIALFRTGHTVSQVELENSFTLFELLKSNLALLDLATHDYVLERGALDA